MLVGTRRPIPAAAPAPRPAQEVRQAGTVLGTAQPGVETPPAAKKWFAKDSLSF